MSKKRKLLNTVLFLIFVLVVCGKSIAEEKSEFVGRWFPKSDKKAPSGLPDDLGLLEDGTGIVEGTSITWTLRNQRFSFTRSGKVFTYNYKLSGSTLILTDDKGQNEIYSKRSTNPYWPDDPNWADDVSKDSLTYYDPDGLLRLFSYQTDQEPLDIKSQLEMAEIHEMLGNFGFAIKYYKRAANLGDAFAQNKLGEMYRDGKGVYKDKKKSTYWFTEAAKQGNVEAKRNMQQ